MPKVRAMKARLLAAICTISALLASPGLGLTQDDVLQASLMTGWEMGDGHHMAGLSLALAPGWKTYWRSPGEAGIPPVFDWSGSRNVKSVRIHWPSPVVFHVNGMQTVGYVGGVVLPLEVVPADPAQPVLLKARVDMGVCNEICMPAQVQLSADLPRPGTEPPELRAALKARPASAAQAGVGRVSCKVEPIADGLRLTATLDMPAQGPEEAVVFEPADPAIWVAESVTHRAGGKLVSVTEMVGPTGAPFALDRSSLRLTVLGGAEKDKPRAVEIAGCPAP